jgi:hypothetical protein
MDGIGFGGLTLATAPGRVMTPRPATEALAARAVELACDAPQGSAGTGACSPSARPGWPSPGSS